MGKVGRDAICTHLQDIYDTMKESGIVVSSEFHIKCGICMSVLTANIYNAKNIGLGELIEK